MTNIKILIVEDEKTTASILKMLLHKWGYDTHQAFSAKEALSIFRQEKIDMAVVDINIGDAVDGLSYRKSLRKFVVFLLFI